MPWANRLAVLAVTLFAGWFVVSGLFGFTIAPQNVLLFGGLAALAGGFYCAVREL